MRIAVCDDEPAVLTQFVEMLEGYDVAFYQTAAQCREAFQAGSFELLFLDLHLPDGEATELMAEFEAAWRWGGTVVFISSDRSLALELFSYHPFDFLLKPLQSERVQAVVDAVRERLPEPTFCFKHGSERRCLPSIDILSFACYGHKLELTMHEGRIEFYGKLSQIEAELNDFFIRTHQSYLVNQRHIEKVLPDEVRLKGGYSVPLSRRFRSKLCRRLEAT